jgi:hypothetical protein
MILFYEEFIWVEFVFTGNAVFCYVGFEGLQEDLAGWDWQFFVYLGAGHKDFVP